VPCIAVGGVFERKLQWERSGVLWRKDTRIGPFPKVNVREISKPGHVMQDDNVRVTAALVKHPPIVPAFGDSVAWSYAAALSISRVRALRR
jgi:hypothetical protein